MKMTMYIDEGLLARVIKSHGFASKTEAVDASLREMDRKARLQAIAKKGLGFTPEELRASVDPSYDVLALRAVETPSKYGKSRSRR